MMKIYSIFIALLLIGSIGNAQVLSPDSIWQLKMDEVVVSGHFVPRSEKNAIYKVRTIRKKEIEQRRPVFLNDLLRQSLNIDMNQHSVFGSSMEIQGISKENINILVDGIPVIGRLNGVMDLSQIPMHNIDRVEVIQGPVSVFYGTDAMGGIVNLITDNFQKDKGLSGRLSLYGESIGAKQVAADLGSRLGKNIIRISGGLYGFEGTSTSTAEIRNKNWPKKNQWDGGLYLGRKVGTMDFFYKGNIFSEKLISLGDFDRHKKIKDKHYFTKRISNVIGLKGDLGKDFYMDATLSYQNYHRYHDTYKVDTATFEIDPNPIESGNDNAVRYNFAQMRALIGRDNLSTNVNYGLGVEWKTENTSGVRILDGKQGFDTYAIFGSMGFKPTSNLELQPSIRLTHTSPVGFWVSPAFNSNLIIGDFGTIKFSYGRGYRVPSLKELYLDFHLAAGPVTYVIKGNEDLKVEKSHSFNIYMSFAKQVGDYTVKVEPSLFYNMIDNLIALSDIQDFERHYVNINKFKSLGGKLEFLLEKAKTFSFETGIGVTGRYHGLSQQSTENYLYSMDISSALNYHFSFVDFNVIYKYTGARPGFYIDKTSGDLVKTTREAFHHMDINISKPFLSNNIELSLGVKNVFDVKDIASVNNVGEAHSRDLQLWGRSYFVSANFFINK